MRHGWIVIGVGLVLGATVALAHEGPEPDEAKDDMNIGKTTAGQEQTFEPPDGMTMGKTTAGEEQTLTGEVVDAFCYLSHPEQGLGKDHAKCAKMCIKRGLPVAIKVGNQLYLASMDNHTAANAKLAAFAGQQVTVHGRVMERDGQHLIAVSDVKKAQ